MDSSENRSSKIPSIEVAQYLSRLNLSKEAPSLQYLKRLHKAHLLHIPYENLDIHYGKTIIADIQRIYHKVVVSGRGGISYEINALFFHLLHHLGFEAYLGASSPYGEHQHLNPFEHMIVLVVIGGQKYLCDVGYGDHITLPKVIQSGLSQLDHTSYYKFDKDPDDRWVLLQSDDNSLFKKVYHFEDQPRTFIEFLERFQYHQTSTDSSHKKQKLITQLFPEGRITLTDRYLKKELFGDVEKHEILNEDEFLSHLEGIFGISKMSLMP